jgi:hypothetical protein
MIVFATDEGLTHRARSDAWYMDATFDSAPLLFSFSFVRRSEIRRSAVSMLFYPTRANHRMKNGYNPSRISVRRFQSDPSTVITDYELDIINIVSSTFGTHTPKVKAVSIT